MDGYLDDSIGDNVKLLPDLLRSLQKERESLKKQLSGVGSLEGESEWQSVIADVKSTVHELESLSSNATSLSGADSVRSDGVGSVSGEAGACVTRLNPLVEELAELERLQSYLLWLRKIHQLCCQMETQLSSGVFSDVLSNFTSLSSLSVALEKSNCSNLKHYAAASKAHWHTRLKDKLSREFGAILKELQWPFTTSAVSSKAFESWKKREKKFTELFNLLIKLDDRDIPVLESGVAAAKLSDPILLPIEILLQPLRKRFKYHFTGERKTNSKEKPEWYLTQVSTWIRDHTHFLDERVQPLLVVSGYKDMDARLEFIRGLLQEIESKLLSDMSDIVYEDVPMSHLIDELLMFERELRTVLHYPHPHPSPFDVLLGEVPFHKWLTLEKAFAIERLHTIATSETAWQAAYCNMAEADDTRVPECTEGFMELIKGVSERYKSLSSTSHQLQFLELQRDLLLEFHQDLFSNSNKQARVDPISPLFVAYLNASHYIAVVLEEWGEQTFFLELHYYTKTLESPSSSNPLPLQSIQLMRRQDMEYAASEGSVFSMVIEAFSSLVEKLESTIVKSVSDSVQLKCRKYKKEKWHSMVPSSKDQVGKELTQSGAELSSSLSENLLFIEDHLSPLLNHEVFERISDKVDQFIFSEVVLSSHFSEGGAEQLHYDITAVLLPLLSKYCDEMARKQLMERTLEACKLLQLLPGSAKLLQELLAGAIKRSSVSDESYAAAVTALNDMGIHTIDPAQAELILRLRILPS